MKKHILIVEDEKNIADSVGEILTDAGYDVTFASNGKIALKILGQNQSFSLILLDLSMPELDGVSFRELQELNPDTAKIPVVILSAMTSKESQKYLFGVKSFLKKPLDINILLDAVKRYAL